PVQTHIASLGIWIKMDRHSRPAFLISLHRQHVVCAFAASGCLMKRLLYHRGVYSAGWRFAILAAEPLLGVRRRPFLSCARVVPLNGAPPHHLARMFDSWV